MAIVRDAAGRSLATLYVYNGIQRVRGTIGAARIDISATTLANGTATVPPIADPETIFVLQRQLYETACSSPRALLEDLRFTSVPPDRFDNLSFAALDLLDDAYGAIGMEVDVPDECGYASSATCPTQNGGIECECPGATCSEDTYGGGSVMQTPDGGGWNSGGLSGQASESGGSVICICHCPNG